MNIKLELLKIYISDVINSKLEDFEIDASQIADTSAIQMITEIQKIIKDENYSDFDAIEEIVCIFERYNIDCGFRHDFWGYFHRVETNMNVRAIQTWCSKIILLQLLFFVELVL